MNENWNEYAQTGTASHITVRCKKKRGNERGKVIVGAEKPLSGHRTDDKEQRSREHLEPRECPQKERKTCLHVCCYRIVFRVNEVADSAVVREVSLMAR